MTTTTDRGEAVGIGVALKVLVPLTLVAASLTTTFMSMRAVMDIGGFCADGGPFVIEHPCPDGVPLLMTGGIWIGVIAAMYYGFQVISRSLPSAVGLLWPALFLSLGWNFLQFGVSPPSGLGSGPAWGWLVCGIVFWVMGGVPLVAWLKVTFSAERPSLARSGHFSGAVRSLAAPLERPIVDTAPDDPDGVVTALERLHHLFTSGALDESEYRAAKRKLIGGRP